MTLRLAAHSANPAVLADVFDENVNIAVWKRELSDDLQDAAIRFVASNPSFKRAMTVSPDGALACVSEALGTSEPCTLSTNIAGLVEMFCYLLGIERAGLRLGVLDAAMCPKFHVDRVPCRLVTTFLGSGTEWLPNDVVDRTKLGLGSGGLPDLESGLLQTENDIERLSCGDVAMLKGELWEGNEGAGLVHRSPTVTAGDARLLLTLDVSH